MECRADGETLQLTDFAVPFGPRKGLLPFDSVKEGGTREAVIRNQTAAVELQRVYRGHRVRRNLADAATMAHKFGWWNVVEGAVLQSCCFYAYNKPQSAAQRWLRLKMKASKVGKGLSKNEKARKLALQHWLEAIDPKHRYGHNLHFYYEIWDKSPTHEPFFYWLDIGEGKSVDLPDCKRSKMQKEQIRYMSPEEREWFEVAVQNGKLVRRMTGELINTPKGDKYIFVMSTAGKLYVGKKERGKIQHSSFLAGGATIAAGRLVVNDGTIELLEAHSGHYRPTQENFDQLVSTLKEDGVNLTLAKVQYISAEMSSSMKSSGDSSDTPVVDVPACSEDVQKQQCNNDDLCSRDVASLDLDAEANALDVDKVTLMESSSPNQAQDKREVVIEGLENLHNGDSMDDSGVREKLEGLRVEILESEKTSQVQTEVPAEWEVGKSATKKSSFNLPAYPVSQHKLFVPALRTLCKLDDRPGIYLPNLRRAHTEGSVDLTAKSKAHLRRGLSIIGPAAVASC